MVDLYYFVIFRYASKLISFIYIYIYIYIFQIIFHYRLIQNIGYVSLYYTVNSLCLSILCILVCIC